ncbi:unnamed protein product [Schistosoma turkestanicum]|nr:unnamed protein product [Schistosoma turkestanicum]
MDRIISGFFLDDQRYGPGILITHSLKSSSNPYEIDVGYWKNDRLIRLRKSVLNRNKNRNQEFHFSKQFPQYNFYKLVNLNLMFKHVQYQKSIKKDSELSLLTLNNEQGYYQYSNEKKNEFNDYFMMNSTDLFFQIIQNILKQSNLPKSFQVWNVKSPLFEKFIADQSFKQLLRCIPSTLIQSSNLKLNNLKQGTEIIEHMQNVELNVAELKSDVFKQQQFENVSKQNFLFDSQFKQNQTVCLVEMKTYISQIAYLQEYLHKSCQQTLNWFNLFKLSIDEEEHRLDLENSIQYEYCTNIEQVFMNEWSTIWNKLSKKSIRKSNKQKLKHHGGDDAVNGQFESTGKHETLAIQFIQYCFNGLFEKVRNLLQTKNQADDINQICIDPNVTDSHGQFGLLGAVLTWNMKLVNLLLDFGANINQLTDDGLTVFTICLLKYYELFQKLANFKNDSHNGDDDDDEVRQNNTDNDKHESNPHILSILAKKSTPINNNNSEENVGENTASLDNLDRNFIYRVELPILLSTTSSESIVQLRRAARLSQIRRMHLNKIRENHLILSKSNDTRRSSRNLKPLQQQLQQQEQSPDVKNDSASTNQSILPTFQRFTNCLTRFNTMMDLKGNVFNQSVSLKSMYDQNRKRRPKSNSIDRRNKKAMIDDFSKISLFNQPYRVKSPSLKRSVAQELSKNPYFLTSHHSNDNENHDSLFDELKQTTDDSSISNSSLDQQALLLAKQTQMMNVIDLLLKRGANPNTGIRPLPALFLAVQAGDPEMVRKLIQSGADANICLRVDTLSKSSNDSALNKIYISEDEPPLMPSLDGLTVLHYAVLVPNEMGIQLTEILLEDGHANPNQQATLDDSFKLKNQFDITTGTTTTTTTTTSVMSENSNELNADKITTAEENPKNGEGRTPLHLVCSREYDQLNSATIAKYLLKYNANPNLLCNGHSALSVAIATGNDPCINVLINHQSTNINQQLGDGLGSALCVACSSLFEFRRSIESRLELIKRLIHKGGIDCFKPLVLSKSKGIYGNVIDFTYMDYAKDTRIAKTPYHALNEMEKETFNGQNIIPNDCVDGDRDKNVEQDKVDGNELLQKRSYPVKPSSPSTKTSRSGSPIYLKKNSVVSYSFCYECGRSVGVRLTICSRCHRVYFCSKVCKLKSWTMRHKNECYLTPGE